MLKFIKLYILEILFSLVFLTLSGILNLQFLEGANVNFTFSGHDEYLTVREVFSILQPLSFKHFIMAIISGDVMYYGRIVFYIDALFAYLPYKIWGLEGMVYAIRMTHAIELLLGVLLLSGFVKTSFGKFFILFSTLMLYYTVYFAMVPKPEPLQLLLLSIFLWKAHKANWHFGWHFIWLGIAYGAKFNVLAILPLFFILPYIFGYKKIIGLLKSFVAFIVGLIIAIPSLLLVPIKPIFLRTYIDNTFGRAQHYDDTVVSLFDWIKIGWLGAYSGGLWIGFALLILIIWGLINGIKKYWTRQLISSELIILIVGLGFLLPVMLFTERIWPHYLWTGHVFLLLSIAVLLNHIEFKPIYLVLMTIVVIGGIISVKSQGSHLFSLQKQSKQLIEDSKNAHTYLLKKNNKMICVQDISVFYPFKEMLKINPYHPFASKLPLENNDYKINWTDFINPKNLEMMKADFLITNKTNFDESSHQIFTEKDRLIETDNALMRSEIGKTILLDSVIGHIKIYKIIHD